MHTKWLAAILLCGAICLGDVAALPTTEPAATQPGFHVDMKATLDYLASDALEGRMIGTPGIALAGDLIAQDFRKLGLQPLPGQTDYFQPFTYTTGVSMDPKTFLQWGDQNYKPDIDFGVPGNSGEGAFDGPLVFAGYGVVSNENAYDDYAGIDVKGKVVLVLRFEPHNKDGSSRFAKEYWSDHATVLIKAREAAKRGAVALIVVNPPTYHPGGDVLYGFSSGMRAAAAPMPIVQVRQTVADAWLKAGGAKDLKTLQAQIDDNAKAASIALANVRVTGTVALQRIKKELRNVLAMLPGEGPHASEYVFVGAHYDHLGHGGPGSLAPGSHAIFNGADDNASGTTTMLAVADYFAHAGPQRRTLVFAAWTGEEEGLIGSNYFMNHPLVPAEKIVADLNLDMVGRVRNNILYIGGAGTAADFDALLKKADEGLPFDLRTFGRGGYGPSDHMSFALKKVPVLFLFSGMHADYHRPSDKADKVNFEGMAQVATFAERIVTGLENLPREKYVDASDSMGGMHMRMSAGGGGAGASLGVVPDYSNGIDTETKGVRITGTVPDSPAAAAGLKADDVIVQFGKDKIDTLYDLSDELGKAKPGDQVTLGVMRGKDRIELQATLAARRAD
jgi:hypothetical protein